VNGLLVIATSASSQLAPHQEPASDVHRPWGTSVAVARSILVIIWQFLSHPGPRYHDLGADYHTSRIDTERRTRTQRPTTRSVRLHRHPHRRGLTNSNRT